VAQRAKNNGVLGFYIKRETVEKLKSELCGIESKKLWLDDFGNGN
jgi:hypothetical protein